MSESHEVECPDGVGLGGGKQSLRRDFFSPNKSIRNEIIVVECCCILIIYYCWQAPSAYLPSRAGEMASFVKNSCFVYVSGLAPRPCSFVVGSLFHLRTLLLIAQAQCLSVGWSWRAIVASGDSSEGFFKILKTPEIYYEGLCGKQTTSVSTLTYARPLALIF